jgi:c-di-GMP-binding flagellar brake protein YcgR
LSGVDKLECGTKIAFFGKNIPMGNPMVGSGNPYHSGGHPGRVEIPSGVANIMESTEILTGGKLRKFFEHLKKDRSVIRMNLLGQNYERLTMIIGVQNKKEPFQFHIDYPSEFEKAVKKTDPWKIYFEFLGKDRVTYRFRTFGGHLSGGDISIPFPEMIERIQRRGSFRMETPPSSKMLISRNAKCLELSVVNLSESGALVEMDRDTANQPLLETGDYLEKPAILVSEPKGHTQVNIKEALVKRVEKPSGRLSYRYALQFTELKPGTRRDLRDLIYRFQRDFLKKRQMEEE